MERLTLIRSSGSGAQIVSVFFDHMSQFNRVEYPGDFRRIIVFRTYPVEMALLALERFVIKVLWRRLFDRLSKAMEAEESAFGCWLDRFKAMKR